MLAAISRRIIAAISRFSPVKATGNERRSRRAANIDLETAAGGDIRGMCPWAKDSLKIAGEDIITLVSFWTGERRDIEMDAEDSKEGLSQREKDDSLHIAGDEGITSVAC